MFAREMSVLCMHVLLMCICIFFMDCALRCFLFFFIWGRAGEAAVMLYLWVCCAGAGSVDVDPRYVRAGEGKMVWMGYLEEDER